MPSKTNEALISPPLTPKEPLSPTITSTQTTVNHRKDFIHAYARIVPQLRPSHITKKHRIIELNVYQHYYAKCCKKSPPQKKKRVSISLPTGKDAAVAFDAIDIDSCDQEFYPAGWVPSQQALDQVPVKVSWKGAPLSIDKQPYLDRLHPTEASMASVLRLTPIQYIRCKRTLILASRTLKKQKVPFTKSIAQKQCRVDVNKTSALWTAFRQLGWFNGPTTE